MFRLLLRLILITFFLALAGVAFIFYKVFYAPNTYPGGKEKVLFVSKGMTFTDVVDHLTEKKLIENRWYFELVAELSGGENTVIVGKYSIPSGRSNLEILNLLRSGGAIIPVVVTIPEGMKITSIARLLRREAGIDSARYAQLAFEKKFTRRMKIDAHTLEGYLFPATYEVMWQMNEEDILHKQVEKFRSEFPEEWKSRAERMNITLHEVLTLASIVEGETAIDSERAVVAGVYLNRLRKQMPLQADPTIQYALPDGPRRLKYSDYKIQSPFNTYRYYGLPPGPVNNPGRESILAVLFPKKHNNMFFVANGTGGHTFTTNYADHLHAVKKLQKLLKERERLKNEE